MRVSTGWLLVVDTGALMTFCPAHDTGVSVVGAALMFGSQATSGCEAGVAMTTM
jgi:hypothetical protein